MASRLITCPESAHLERIEFDTSPFGILIRACSSACGESCPRTCAALMDRSGREPFILEVRSVLARGTRA